MASEKAIAAWSEEAIAKAIYVFETTLVENGPIREQNQQRLRAALDAAAAVDGDAGWKQIGGAPKDGTKVDLWIVPPLGQLSSGSCRITDCWFHNGEWRTEDAGAPEGWASIIWEPTYWMIPPTPPSAH